MTSTVAIRGCVLVTGASGGIGAAIARTLAARGHPVAVHYCRGEAAAHATVEAIRDNGGRAEPFQADLVEPAASCALLERVVGNMGPPHAVVSAAGIAYRAPVLEVTTAEFDRVFALNARGTFFLLQESARRIVDGGTILAISAGSTVVAPAGSAVYAASKAAIVQYCRALARELAPRQVTVNVIAPGPIDTPLLRQFPGALDGAARLAPLGRVGVPSDVAGVVDFLVGPAARWMTGQVLHVSGGAVFA